MSTTKSDIVGALYFNLPLVKGELPKLITDSVFELIREALERGEEVKLPSFGKFSVRSKTARNGRNPKTGEIAEVAARKVVTFKPSDILKKRVNG